MVRIGGELALRQERRIHSVITQIDNLIDLLHAIEKMFDLADGFGLATLLENAKEELTKATALNVSKDRIAMIQEAVNTLIHVNENIEYGLMDFGVSERSCLQKTLIVLIKQLYSLMYNDDGFDDFDD
jgi:predicted mannosyl-3-phosphoglycerate phosphatase (HAD superfamily)